MNKTSIIITIITTLFGAGGLFGFLTERRKRKADVKTKELSNIEKIFSLYDKSMSDLEDRRNKKAEEIQNICEQKINMLEKKANDLQILYEKKVKLLEDEIRQQKRKINSLKRENSELKKRIYEYESTK